MQEIVGVLEEQQLELAGLIADLDDEGWNRPSACEGWSISDVVLHLAQSNEMAIASTHGEFGTMLGGIVDGAPPVTNVDEGAEVMVVQDRGRPPSEVHACYQRSSADLRQGLLAHEPGDRVQWVAGDMAARTLATTRLAETWIHTGDVAVGLDVTLEPTDRLWHIARLAWRTIPYAFQRAGREAPGPVAFRLTGPNGDAWSFGDDDAPTVITGSAHDLCQVAAQRATAADTTLVAQGPDAEAVLELVRTFA